MSERPVKVLALLPFSEEAASVRFRVSQFLPFLATAGFDIETHALIDTDAFRLLYRRGHKLEKVAALVSSTSEPGPRVAPPLRPGLHPPGSVSSRATGDRTLVGQAGSGDLRLRRRDLSAERQRGQPRGEFPQAAGKDRRDRRVVDRGDRRQCASRGVRAALLVARQRDSDVRRHVDLDTTAAAVAEPVRR